MFRWLNGLFSPRNSDKSSEEAAEEIKSNQKRVFGTRDFEVGVAGTSHYQQAIGAATKGKKSYGDRVYINVVLQTEPENPHDPNAVKVMTTNQQTIGYLYREKAEQYAPKIQAWQDRGKWVGCQGTVVGKGQDVKVYLDIDKPDAIVA